MSRLEGPDGTPGQVKKVAEETGVTPAYLSKTVHKLGRSGLLRTKRGVKGGVVLAREPDSITLLEISDAIDGPEWLGRCLLGLEECSDERSCPTHEFWKRTREQIRTTLASTTLDQVKEFEGTGWATQLLSGEGTESAGRKVRGR